MQNSLAIATVPRYPEQWQESASNGAGSLIAPQWIGWQHIQSAIRPGNKVFILCNFVQERRFG